MKRNLQLDFLRGFSIFLVLGQHLGIAKPEGWLGIFARFWTTNGWLGVELFFVLSGFLVGGLLLSENSRHGRVNVGRFLIRRGLKIYPPYFIFLAYLICMPLLKAFLNKGDLGGTLMKGFSDYWPNFLFLQTYIGGCPAGHTWTLANEEHFYLLLPLVIVALLRLGRIQWVVGLCIATIPAFIAIRAAALYFDDPYAREMMASHLRLDAMFAGLGLRGLAEYHPRIFAEARKYRSILLGVGLLLWARGIFRIWMGDFHNTVGISLTIMGSCAVLLVAFQTGARDFGFLRVPVARLAAAVAFVGTYSYSIYLWHVTFMQVTKKALVMPLMAWAGLSSSLTWVASALIASVAAIIGGIVISKIVEWPVLVLRDRYFPSPSTTIPVAAA